MTKTIALSVLLAFVSLDAFSQERHPHRAGIDQAESKTTINPEEISIMLFLREQELMSYDVYSFFLALYPKPVFQNIGLNGLNHSEMVHLLLIKNNQPDPARPRIPGKYTDSTITAHYQHLIAKGRASQDTALLACLSLEEFDLQQLMLFQLKAENPDVINLLDVLSRGARNHIRALNVRCTEKGLRYEPRYLSPEYYNLLIKQPHERGRNH